MSDPGTKTASKYKPEETIIIKGGDVIPEDKDVFVLPRAVVKFSNEDSQSYTIVFLVHNQDPFFPWATHADVDLFLPGFGSATMVADRDIIVGQCKYLVEPTSVDSIGQGGRIEELENAKGAVAPPAEACASATSGDAVPIRPRILVAGKTGGGGGGGTIHIGS